MVALNLDPQQVKQAETQKSAAQGAVTARLPETYQWLLVPTQPTPQSAVEWQALRLSGQEARIKQDHFGVWNPVTVWRVETRYSVVGTAQEPDATAMIAAAEELLAIL